MGPLKINFRLFGDENTGSSRLRGYKLARELNKMGHVATINGKNPADIHVFQKILDFAQLGAAKANRAIVTYDLDDNYLLEQIGTKNDVLRFISFADVVTVGSRMIAETATRYHHRVYLFENPLDVLDERIFREYRPWQHRLGWFGNPCNLPALEALDLSGVTTVTENGDIQWDLNTVDHELMKFDLVLIPVLASDWTLSKNANRLLKCVALGVPFLASDTPEHCRAVERLQLPATEFLISERESWHERIDDFMINYESRCRTLLDRREHALKIFAIRRVAEQWLQNILALAKSANSVTPINGEPRRRFFSDVDAVILNESGWSQLDATLQSVCAENVPYHSLTVISAVPLSDKLAVSTAINVIDDMRDFFDIYTSLFRVFEESQARRILFLQAGSRLSYGFFHEAMVISSRGPLSLFATQAGPPQFTMSPLPPGSMAALLAEPFVPGALLGETALLKKHAPQARLFFSLGLWDLLIGAFLVVKPVVCEAPLIQTDAESLDRNPVAAYGAYLDTISPSLGRELPDCAAEWARLEATLVSQIVEARHELFCRYTSALIPLLLERRRAAWREVKRRQKAVQSSTPEPRTHSVADTV